MTECNSDMLLDYVNDALTHEERCEVLKHISHCAACREELSELLAMKRIVSQARPRLPEAVRADAFRLLPDKRANRSGVIDMALSPVAKAVSPATDSIMLVKKTLKLAVSFM